MGPLLQPTPTLPGSPDHPAGQPLVHAGVQLVELPVGISRPKVVAPSPEHGVQFGDDLLPVVPAAPRLGQLMDASPDPFHRLGRRPPLHIVPPWIPQDASLLPDRTSPENKTSLPPPQVHHPRLLRMQHQTQLARHKLDLSKRLLRLRLRWRHHHEIVGIADPHPERPTLLRPEPIQQVQVDVGQQRREDSALRGSRQRLPHRTVFHHPGLQPLSDQFQYPPIRDSLSHQHHQLFLIDAVEIALDVRIDYEVMPLVSGSPDRFQSLRRALLRTKSIAAVFEIRLKDRLDDDLRRHLHHPVSYRRYPQWPLLPASLVYVLPPHR